MAQLKVYDWESEKFPNGQLVRIREEYRIPLTLKLCSHFKIIGVRVRLSTSGGGLATYPAMIKLPKPNYHCELGTIFHEIAHIYNYQENNAKVHTGTFKTSLIKIYVEGWNQLPRIFREIKQEIEAQKELAIRQVEKESRKAERNVQQKELKKTRSFKIEHLKKRIKRLESKRKRIETILKFANRSLKILERFAALEQIKTETHSSQRATA